MKWVRIAWRKIGGALLILMAYAYLFRITEHNTVGWKTYFTYGGFIVLLTGGFAVILEKKHKPFEPWVRMAGAVAILNGIAVMLIQQSMTHVHFPGPDYMWLGQWLWDWSRVLALPMIYLLVAGERENKKAKYDSDDPRHIWIRLCGFLILAWACGYAVNIWLTRYWESGAVGQTERVGVLIVGTVVNIAFGLALLVWPHKAEKPIP